MKRISTRWLAAGWILLLGVMVVSVQAKPASQGVAWRVSLQPALKEARRLKKPIMVDLSAAWCSPCRAMDERTYNQTVVVRESRKWLPVKVDIDAHPEIAERYGLKTPPMVVFLRTDGSLIGKLTGYTDAAGMVKQMKAAYAKSRNGRKSAKTGRKSEKKGT